MDCRQPVRGGTVVITWVCGANPFFTSKGSFLTEDAEKAASASSFFFTDTFVFLRHCIYLDKIIVKISLRTAL